MWLRKQKMKFLINCSYLSLKNGQSWYHWYISVWFIFGESLRLWLFWLYAHLLSVLLFSLGLLASTLSSYLWNAKWRSVFKTWSHWLISVVNKYYKSLTKINNDAKLLFIIIIIIIILIIWNVWSNKKIP